MTIKFSISKDLMKNVVSSLSTVNTDITFFFTEDGMTVRANDVATVAFARVIVPKSMLKGYDNVYNRKFYLLAESLDKMLRSCEDELEIIVYDEGSMAGLVEVVSGDFTWRTDMNVTEMDINRFPDLSPSIIASFSAKAFNSFLGNADKKDVELQFLYQDSKAKLCLGNIRKGCSQVFIQDEPVQDANVYYNLSYIAALGKAASKAINDRLTIALSDNYPLRAEFEIAEGVSVVEYIAPWIHEE